MSARVLVRIGFGMKAWRVAKHPYAALSPSLHLSRHPMAKAYQVLYVSGMPGTGKTASVLQVVSAMQKTKGLRCWAENTCRSIFCIFVCLICCSEACWNYAKSFPACSQFINILSIYTECTACAVGFRDRLARLSIVNIASCPGSWKILTRSRYRALIVGGIVSDSHSDRSHEQVVSAFF